MNPKSAIARRKYYFINMCGLHLNPLNKLHVFSLHGFIELLAKYMFIPPLITDC